MDNYPENKRVRWYNPKLLNRILTEYRNALLIDHTVYHLVYSAGKLQLIPNIFRPKKHDILTTFTAVHARDGFSSGDIARLMRLIERLRAQGIADTVPIEAAIHITPPTAPAVAESPHIPDRHIPEQDHPG